MQPAAKTDAYAYAIGIGQKELSVPVLSLLIQRLSSLLVIVMTVYCVVDYPFARVPLGLALAAYAAWLLIQPSIWLLVLPLVLPLVNLAPWSGRFYLEDFDFFIGITVAGALWHGAYSSVGRPRFARVPRLLVAFFFLTHCIALLRGLLPFAPIEANAFNNYYSHYNALRVGKSLILAVLLIPPLLRAFGKDRERARNHLVLGVSLGLIGAGIAILWERGVVLDLLYGRNLYEKLSNLTNFSSEYRATALFSEMHTGGEAIDGYLAMAWPFALAILAASRSWWSVAVGMVGLPAGLYSALVTFSRGTYMAVSVSLLTFAVPYCREFFRRAAMVKTSWLVPFVLLAVMSACALLYGKGGHYAMVAALGIMTGSILLIFFNNVRMEVRAILMIGLLVVGFVLMMRGLVTSKWVNNGFSTSLAISLPISLATLWAGIFIGGQARQIISLRGLCASLVFFAVLIAVCVPALSGSYMKSRFSTTQGDFGGRVNHWMHALGLMDSSVSAHLFGMGLGVFPRAYLSGNEQEKSSISVLQDDGANTYLSLSNSMDLTMGQRLSLLAGQPYTLILEARTRVKNATMYISICRRNIIAPRDDECISTGKVIASEQWQRLDWAFDIGQLGDGLGIGRHPLVLRIAHYYYNPQSENNLPLAFIDIDNIAVVDQYGVDHLVNGDFQDGLDNWYPSSDHYHLPLHIKNLWVNIYFEQGLLGLAAFCGLGLYVAACGVRQARQGDVFGLTLLSSLMGFFSVGLIGTLYDVPRVIFLFFLLLFTLLSQDKAQLASFRNRHKDTPSGTAPATKRSPSFVRPVRGPHP